MGTYDFSGWATKANLLCSDGRVIRPDAFQHDDGKEVPLVWQHMQSDPGNILGRVRLEHRADGVYAYGSFNNNAQAVSAREAVKHGDIKSLSIYANELSQAGNNVMHGTIREVSLCVAGANPGAVIDNLSFAHSDGNTVISEQDAIITTGEPIVLQHADEPKEQPMPDANDEKTVKDVVESMNEEQRTVLYYLIAQAQDDSGDSGDQNMSQSYNNDNDNDYLAHEGGSTMTRNVFMQQDIQNGPHARVALSHAQISEIIQDAQNFKSMRDSVLAHAGEYGITNIDILFPDATEIAKSPSFIARRNEWVSGVLNGTSHRPFSRIKSVHADITADEARALGYFKGNRKKEEVFPLLKRVTTPTTVYKKQKLDRDDIVDITSLDVVAWIKAEMRLMLDEEIARAVLVGDGRLPDSEDKIKDPMGSNEGAGIRSIYHDDPLYSIKVQLPANRTPAQLEDAIVLSRIEYRGSGTPKMYMTAERHTALMLQRDGEGRRMYKTEAELAAALRVSEVIEVPIIAGQKRTVGGRTYNLVGIIANISDYSIGADKGGEVSMFDDFDIDFNQFKYLLETRISGALTDPFTAIVIEEAVA